MFIVCIAFLWPRFSSAGTDETRTPISSSPYIVNSSGSYYLTGNLTSSGNGITVNADNVVIDLNGFTITGNNTNDGIYMNGRSNIEVKNGTVKGFDTGINEHSTATLQIGHRMTNVRAVFNVHDGMSFANNENIIKNCTVSRNGRYGVYSTGDANRVTNTVVIENALDGISMSRVSTVIDTTASLNRRSGIVVAEGSLVTGNNALSNSGSGISTGYGSTVLSNVADKNSNHGIQTSTACTIKDNVAISNGLSGIALQNYSLLVHNTAFGNDTSGMPPLAYNAYNITPAQWCDPWGFYCEDWGLVGCTYIDNAAP